MNIHIIIKSKKPYVYGLFDTGILFYVGKGKYTRIHQHNGKTHDNPYTKHKINKMIKNNTPIEKEILAVFDNDIDALWYETALIFLMPQLTNLALPDLFSINGKSCLPPYKTKKTYEKKKYVYITLNKQKISSLVNRTGMLDKDLIQKAEISEYRFYNIKTGKKEHIEYVLKLIKAINKELGTNYKIEDIDGISY